MTTVVVTERQFANRVKATVLSNLMYKIVEESGPQLREHVQIDALTSFDAHWFTCPQYSPFVLLLHVKQCKESTKVIDHDHSSLGKVLKSIIIMTQYRQSSPIFF